MPTLYDITSDALRIQAVLDGNDGELTPELEAELDGLLAAGADKLDAAASVYRSLLARADELKEEAYRLDTRAARALGDADRLKARMLAALQIVHGGKLKTDRNTFWTQRPAPSVTFEAAPGKDLNKLPLKFISIHTSLRSSVLRDAHRAGEDMPDGIVVIEKHGDPYLRLK